MTSDSIPLFVRLAPGPADRLERAVAASGRSKRQLVEDAVTGHLTDEGLVVGRVTLPEPAPEVLTPIDAAALLRLPPDELEAAAERGDVPARLIAGQYRFSRAGLLAWLGHDPSGPAAPAPLVSVRRIVPDLQVEDPAAGIAFYRDVLGLEVAMDLGWIVTFAAPGRPTAQLSLLRPDASASVQAEVSIEVDDVDAVHDAVRRLGHEVVHPLTDEPWGVRRFFVRDPGGKVVNVLSHRPGG